MKYKKMVANLEAAKRLGIELPVRRYKNDSEHFNKKDKPKRYCIVCVVNP